MPYPSPPRLSGRVHLHYWSESAHERTVFLSEWVARLEAERIPTTVHEGWTRSDLTVYPHGWTSLNVCTVQEDHSGGRRLLRVRLGLVPDDQMGWAAGGVVALVAVGLAVPAVPALVAAAVLTGVAAVAWRVGLERRARVAALADQAAAAIGMVSMRPDWEAAPELEAAPAPESAPELEAEPVPEAALDAEAAPVPAVRDEPPAERAPVAGTRRLATLPPLGAAPAVEKVRYDEEARERTPVPEVEDAP